MKIIMLDTPGPGSYRSPSEFGLYESKGKDAFEENEKKKFGTTTFQRSASNFRKQSKNLS